MKFKAGDKVWAISTEKNLSVPTGEYPGTIVEFLETAGSPMGLVEVYWVDLPEVPSHDNRGWVIPHPWLRPRDGDRPDLNSDTYSKTSWSKIPGWNPMKVTASTRASDGTSPRALSAISAGHSNRSLRTMRSTRAVAPRIRSWQA